MNTIADYINELVLDGRGFGIACTVVSGSYDEDTQTVSCLPINGNAEFTARLQAEPKPGLLYIPKDGSVVMVEQTSENSGYVSMWGEVEEVVFLGGENKGMVKVTELVDKLNTLESDINDLKTAFSSWITVPNDGGAALKAAAASWYSSPLTPTQISDLENDKVQH